MGPVKSEEMIWRVEPLIQAPELHQRNIFMVDFEPDSTAWIATSDSLYRYDGYHWQRYATEDGLPSSFIRCVLVTRSGAVWVGTDRGAAVLESDRFRVPGESSGLPGMSIRRIREDDEGGLWFCCDRWPDPSTRGGLGRLYEGEWTVHTAEDHPSLGYVKDTFEDSSGQRYALTQEGLLAEEETGWRNPLLGLKDGEGAFWAIAETADGSLLANTHTSLFERRGQDWRYYEAPFPSVLSLGSTRSGQVYAVGVEEGGEGACFRRWMGGRFIRDSETFPFPSVAIEFVVEAPDESIWCGGYDYLMRWERREEGWAKLAMPLPSPCVLDDRGRLWMADQSGAVRWDGVGFESIPGFLSGELRKGPEGRIWGWEGSSVHLWEGDTERVFDGREVGFMNVKGCTFDAQGTPWFFGEDDEGILFLACCLPDGWREGRKLEGFDALSVSSAVADPAAGVWYSLLDPADGSIHLLHIRETEFTEHSVPEGLVPFSRAYFTWDRQGYGWLCGGNAGLLMLDPQTWEWDPLRGLLGRGVRSIAVDREEVWFVMNGFIGGRSGLAQWRGGTLQQYEVPVLPADHFAQDRTLFFPAKGSLYIVAPKGDSSGSLSPPVRLSVPFDDAVTGVVRDPLGCFWVGAAGQVYRYSPRSFPPQTLLHTDNARVTRDSLLVFELDARQRFVVSTNRAGSIDFSYRLDGGEWSPFIGRRHFDLEVSALSLGHHLLEARARDESLNIDPTPVHLKFSVGSVPLQERPGFWPGLIGVFAVIVSLAILLWVLGRKVRRYAENLEQLVEERTESLRTSERKLRAIFNQTFQFSGLLAKDGTLLSANEPALRFVGCEEHQVLGQKYWETPWWNHSAECQAEIKKGVERGAKGEFVRFETTHRDAKGREHIFDFSLKPVLDEKGEVVYLLPEGRDVTETRRLEDQLRQSQKMEAVGKLAGGIAHDFNNLLTAILGYCDLLLVDLPAEASSVEAVQEIKRAGQRAAALTRQLLAFSRRQILKPTVLNVNKLIQNMQSMLSRLIGEDVRLVVSLAPDLYHVEADPGQLEQIIMNLAVNARDAMVQGGEFTITTDNVEVERLTSTGPASPQPGSYVRIRFQDTGCGMDEEIQERLFEPFFTTKEQGQGTGLGLSTVYGIVKQSQGNIEVQSEPGAGTTFTVLLPKATEDETSFHEDLRAAPPTRGKGNVLLIEDDNLVCSMIEVTLQKAGYRVLKAADGEEALQLSARHPGDVHLLISDVVLPGRSGPEVAAQLLKQRSDMAVLYISGYTSDAVLQRGGLQEGVHFLQKPFSPETLRKRIEELMEHPASDAPSA